MLRDVVVRLGVVERFEVVGTLREDVRAGFDDWLVVVVRVEEEEVL